MLELLLAALVGVALGVVTGLLPGLHPNTLIPLLVGLAAFIDPLTAAVMLVTAGVVNSFVSFIPAILLGAPEDAEALSVLPGHRMLLAGRGYEAIRLTVIGGLGAAVLSLLLLPVMWMGFPAIYALTRPSLHWMLATVVIYMIISERGLRSNVWAAVTFGLAGILGVLALDSFGNGALFPLLTGLFGLPMLLLSLRRGVAPPAAMSYESEPLPARQATSGIAVGSLAGVLVGLLPGVGSSQAAVLAQEVIGVILARPRDMAAKMRTSAPS